MSLSVPHAVVLRCGKKSGRPSPVVGMGGWKLGIMPRSSAVIATSYLCDGGKKLLYRMSQDASCPFYLLDVPYDRSRVGEKRLRDQVERVISDVIGRVPGISADGMGEAIRASNEALGS